MSTFFWSASLLARFFNWTFVIKYSMLWFYMLPWRPSDTRNFQNIPACHILLIYTLRSHIFCDYSHCVQHSLVLGTCMSNEHSQPEHQLPNHSTASKNTKQTCILKSLTPSRSKVERCHNQSGSKFKVKVIQTTHRPHIWCRAATSFQMFLVERDSAGVRTAVFQSLVWVWTPCSWEPGCEGSLGPALLLTVVACQWVPHMLHHLEANYHIAFCPSIQRLNGIAAQMLWFKVNGCPENKLRCRYLQLLLVMVRSAYRWQG